MTGRKRRLKDDENIELSEYCCSVLEKKLPRKLKDPCACTIPCTTWMVSVGWALRDSGASKNLMPLSMMKMLGYVKPKPTKMTLTLTYRSISYPYRVLENVLVKVNDLLFQGDFVIPDMEEDVEIPLL